MKNLLDKAIDGCHRLGWVINLIVMVVMFAYFQGELASKLQAAEDRLARIEHVLDQMLVNRQ